MAIAPPSMFIALQIDGELAHAGERLHREGLVELDHVDVGHLQPGTATSAFSDETTGP